MLLCCRTGVQRTNGPDRDLSKEQGPCSAVFPHAPGATGLPEGPAVSVVSASVGVACLTVDSFWRTGVLKNRTRAIGITPTTLCFRLVFQARWKILLR